MDEYVKPEDARRILGVSDDILRKWAREGKIEYIRIGKGTHRRYKIDSFLPKKERRRICYARVSSAEQKADLESQVRYLRERYPNHEIVKDIGSGLNFERKGFKAILDSAIKGDIEEIVVSSRDRLCRFGFELIRLFVEKSGGKITVLGDERNKSSEQELSEDLLSIIHIYSCRQMGKRSYKNKQANEIVKDKTETVLSPEENIE